MASESILPPGHEWAPVYLPTLPEVGDGLYGFKTTIQVKCFKDVGKEVLEHLEVSLDIFLADPSSWEVYVGAIPKVRLGLLGRMVPLRGALEKAGYDAGGFLHTGPEQSPTFFDIMIPVNEALNAGSVKDLVKPGVPFFACAADWSPLEVKETSSVAYLHLVDVSLRDTFVDTEVVHGGIWYKEGMAGEAPFDFVPEPPKVYPPTKLENGVFYDDKGHRVPPTAP